MKNVKMELEIENIIFLTVVLIIVTHKNRININGI